MAFTVTAFASAPQNKEYHMPHKKRNRRASNPPVSAQLPAKRTANETAAPMIDDGEHQPFHITAAGTFDDCALKGTVPGSTTIGYSAVGTHQIKYQCADSNCNAGWSVVKAAGWSVVKAVPAITAGDIAGVMSPVVTAGDIADSLAPVEHCGRTIVSAPSATVKLAIAAAILDVARHPGGATRVARPLIALADEACASSKEALKAGGAGQRAQRDPLRNARVYYYPVGSFNTWGRDSTEMVSDPAAVFAQNNTCCADNYAHMRNDGGHTYLSGAIDIAVASKITGDSMVPQPLVVDTMYTYNGAEFKYKVKMAKCAWFAFRLFALPHTCNLIQGVENREALFDYINSDEAVSAVEVPDNVLHMLYPTYPGNHRDLLGANSLHCVATHNSKTGHVCLHFTTDQLASTMASNQHTTQGNAFIAAVEPFVNVFVAFAGGKEIAYTSWSTSWLYALLDSAKAATFSDTMLKAGRLLQVYQTPSQKGGAASGAAKTAAATAVKKGEATAEDHDIVKSLSESGKIGGKIGGKFAPRQAEIAAQEPLSEDEARKQALKDFLESTGGREPRSGPKNARKADKKKLAKLFKGHFDPAGAARDMQLAATKRAEQRAKKEMKNKK